MENAKPKISTFRRKVLFRVLAFGVGVCLVLCVEGLLWIAGFGQVGDRGDPYIGFDETKPLFVLDAERQEYVIPKSRQVFFQPDSFAAQKADNEFRVFCLGGSTVQGRPYSIETSFTTWLELKLKAADPSTKWQVVNCGGVSYASYRLIPIMQEVLQYEPDLFIVCTGHNEFLEERTYADVKHRPAWLTGLQRRLSSSRIYGVLKQLRPTQAEAAAVNLSAEVDALLDYQGGLAKYHRDDTWRDGVTSHYAHNLRRMAHIARTEKTKLLFVNPVSNIRDTPPFKVELAAHLSPDQRQRFSQLWEDAKAAPWDDLQAKAAMLEDLLAIDGRHAEARFLLAKVYEASGKVEQAREQYLLAKDNDICPLRMLESMHADLQRVAKETGTPLIDARAHLESQAENGLVGDEQLIDHIHPRIEEHQQISELLFEQMVDEQLVTRGRGWETRQAELFKANYASLADNYFPESVERLRGLQKWTQGRVTRLKLSPSDK